MAIYRIKKDCWNPTPEERPSFSNILERLTTCTQDPDVMNAPLPSFFRPVSTESDQTIMRPPGNDHSCLQAPNTSDYLIPLPEKAALSLEQYEIGIRNAAERLLLETTGVTMSEATYAAPKIISPAIPHKLNDGSWETSFMLPNSNSDEPLLVENGQEDFIKRPDSQGSLVCFFSKNIFL